jgi:hypothetical protein
MHWIEAHCLVTHALWTLLPCRHHVDGVTGRIKRVYCLDAACSVVPGTCIQGNPFKGGTRMLVASYALSQVGGWLQQKVAAEAVCQGARMMLHTQRPLRSMQVAVTSLPHG